MEAKNVTIPEVISKLNKFQDHHLHHNLRQKQLERIQNQHLSQLTMDNSQISLNLTKKKPTVQKLQLNN